VKTAIGINMSPPVRWFRPRHAQLERNVVVFTIHKAGSKLLNRVLKDICDATNVRYLSENQSSKRDMLPLATRVLTTRGAGFRARTPPGCARLSS